MSYFAIINNITLLVSLSIIYSIILNNLPLKAMNFRIISGILFGGVTIIGMLNAFELQPGIFFDSRTIVLSIAGAFGGPVTALVAVLISGSYRITIGGAGAFMGVLTIVSSASLGTIMHFLIKRNAAPIRPYLFYLLGIVVHLIMLLLTLTLPQNISREIFNQIAFPVILIYPLATLFVAWLFQAQQNQFDNVINLKESEKRFRLIFQKSLAVYLLIDPEDGSIWDANQAAVDFYGWPLPVLKTMTMLQINTLEPNEVLKAITKAKNGEQDRFTFKHKVANGDIKDVEILSGPMEIKKKTLLLSIIQDMTEKRQANEALQQERSLLRTLIDNIPDRVSVKDLNERRILSNLSELMFFGMNNKEISLKKDSELFGNQLGAQLEKDDRSVLKTGNAIINKEEKLPDSKGKPVWVLTSRIPLRNENDQITGLVTISKDITERRESQNQLYNLSLVAEKTSNLVVISNNEDKILWVNRSFILRTGFSSKDVLGRTVAEVLQGPGTDPEHKQKMAEGVARKMAFRQEILNYTKSGEEMWLDVNVNPVLDQKGNIEKIIAISMDISEQKKSESKLRQITKSYSDLFNSLGEAIFIMDSQGQFMDVNHGAEKMYGFSKEEIIGNTPALLSAPEKTDLDYIYKIIKLAYDGIHQELEVWAKRKDGSVFQKEIHFYPGEYYNKKVVLAVAQDITQRKHAEELKTSLEIANRTARLKQRFLANMSHEMRTPLNGVLGMAGVLKKTTLEQEQQKYIKVIEDSSRSLLEIINDVLHLSRIESGQELLSEKLIHKKTFMQRIESYFPEMAKSKGLSFSVKFNDNVPDSFIADESRIMQVINNLAGNAIKFTSKGSVNLYCESIEDEQKNNFIRLSVTDSGKGISQEYHEKIFEEFVQVDASSTRESGGTGLGLSISRRIVTLLGGKIGLSSQPGKGSTFWFTFAYQNKSKLLTCTNNNGNTGEQINKNLDISVLLVEDKKVNQMVARLMLQDMGCKVELAENGQLAIEMISKNKYDIILMDIQMPVMDGVTAVKKLRCMNIPLPVIIGLSAEAMEGDAEKYIALGMDDYLTKPVDQGILFSKLQKWHKKCYN